MQRKSRSKRRRNEVFTGLIIIFMGFSFVVSMLLDFNLGNPYSSLLEDLAYLSDDARNQKISAWAWLITSLITLVAIPFHLLVFHRRLKVLHFIHGLLMLGAAGSTLMMGLVGLELNQLLTQDLVDGVDQANEQVRIGVLEHLRDEEFYADIGGGCAALFAFTLALTRFKIARFPMFSTLLLVISGPLLMVMNWYNPEHVLRTAAIAGIMIGLIVFCVRLINRGITAEEAVEKASEETPEESPSPP